jgi:hypothetical protein
MRNLHLTIKNTLTRAVQSAARPLARLLPETETIPDREMPARPLFYAGCRNRSRHIIGFIPFRTITERDNWIGAHEGYEIIHPGEIDARCEE